LRFENHVVVVTGAASGIGLGTAKKFAGAGATVAMVDRDAEAGRREAAVVGGVFYVADVGDEASVAAAAATIIARFGRVDHLVNNAGIVVAKPIEETSGEEWDAVMNVNVKSVFLMTKHLLPGLKAAPAASIVNLGSVSSFVGQKHTPAYVASKGAVAMLSKSLALDLSGYGIRVNCVCPGITDTPMLRFHAGKSGDAEGTIRARLDRVPLGRVLTPEDIANAILFLCSAEASGITGTTLLVDAGYLATAEWSNG
jgi:NAD(P)-dependent dehydrogenase (short-subunit alcohol dehydrogenase family)